MLNNYNNKSIKLLIGYIIISVSTIGLLHANIDKSNHVSYAEMQVVFNERLKNNKGNNQRINKNNIFDEGYIQIKDGAVKELKFNHTAEEAIQNSNSYQIAEQIKRKLMSDLNDNSNEAGKKTKEIRVKNNKVRSTKAIKTKDKTANGKSTQNKVNSIKTKNNGKAKDLENNNQRENNNIKRGLKTSYKMLNLPKLNTERVSNIEANKKRMLDLPFLDVSKASEIDVQDFYTKQILSNNNNVKNKKIKQTNNIRKLTSNKKTYSSEKVISPNSLSNNIEKKNQDHVSVNNISGNINILPSLFKNRTLCEASKNLNTQPKSHVQAVECRVQGGKCQSAIENNKTSANVNTRKVTIQKNKVNIKTHENNIVDLQADSNVKAKSIALKNIDQVKDDLVNKSHKLSKVKAKKKTSLSEDIKRSDISKNTIKDVYDKGRIKDGSSIYEGLTRINDFIFGVGNNISKSICHEKYCNRKFIAEQKNNHEEKKVVTRINKPEVKENNDLVKSNVSVTNKLLTINDSIDEINLISDSNKLNDDNKEISFISNFISSTKSSNVLKELSSEQLVMYDSNSNTKFVSNNSSSPVSTMISKDISGNSSKEPSSHTNKPVASKEPSRISSTITNSKTNTPVANKEPSRISSTVTNSNSNKLVTSKKPSSISSKVMNSSTNKSVVSKNNELELAMKDTLNRIHNYEVPGKKLEKTNTLSNNIRNIKSKTNKIIKEEKQEKLQSNKSAEIKVATLKRNHISTSVSKRGLVKNNKTKNEANSTNKVSTTSKNNIKSNNNKVIKKISKKTNDASHQLAKTKKISNTPDDQITINKNKNSKSENKELIVKKYLEVPKPNLMLNHYKTASNLYRLGFYDKALSEAQKMISSDPTNLKAYHLIYDIYTEQNRFTDADDTIKLALERKKNDLSLNIIYAKIKIRLGDFKQALSVLQKFTPDIERNPEFYETLALVYSNLGKNKRAADIYKQLVMYDSENGHYWFGLAFNLDKAGNYNTAQELYKKAIASPTISFELSQYARSRLIGGLD